MKHSLQTLLGLLLAFTEANDICLPVKPVNHEDTCPPPACNTPKNRQCWGDYSIYTNYAVEYPTTNCIREYELVVTNQLVAPDGVEVMGMVFNGQFPGPIIEANWGDTLRITVRNHLTNLNGTAVHWHGIRQLNTNWQDGVPGVTSCPITPYSSYTYEFQVTNYGNSWYHSHFALQYPAGLVGPLRINGPTSHNYDIALDPLMLSDWYHKDPFGLFELELSGEPASPVSTLLQGKGHFCDESGKCSGSYHEVIVEKDNVYKMTIINAGTGTHFTYWIDGHSFTVVAVDFVPIEGYVTDTINVAIGQRYDLILSPPDCQHGTDFWIHARECKNNTVPSKIGILRYDASSTALPYTPPGNRDNETSCHDPPVASLVPVVHLDVGNPVNDLTPEEYLNVSLSYYPDVNKKSPYEKWVLHRQTFYIDWSIPTLKLLVDNNDTDGSSFPPETVPIFLDYQYGDWVYFLIETNYTSTDPDYILTVPGFSHPIHLHGHDYYILAQSTEPFDPKTFKPNLHNPPRRDTAQVPGGGYMVLAFQIDNPGAWLMHCHIAWHASAGMAIQFIEMPDRFEKLAADRGIVPEMNRQCSAWSNWYNKYNVHDMATQGAESGI